MHSLADGKKPSCCWRGYSLHVHREGTGKCSFQQAGDKTVVQGNLGVVRRWMKLYLLSFLAMLCFTPPVFKSRGEVPRVKKDQFKTTRWSTNSPPSAAELTWAGKRKLQLQSPVGRGHFFPLLHGEVHQGAIQLRKGVESEK